MTQDQGIGFWGHVATEVTCGLNPSHKFYLPYRKILNVKSIHCPICDEHFAYHEGECHPDDMYPYREKLDTILKELSPSKKEEVYDMLDNWPSVV